MRRSMVSSGGSYKWPYGGSINVTRDRLDPDSCLEYYFEEYAKNSGPPKDLRRFLPQAIKEKGPPHLRLPLSPGTIGKPEQRAPE